MANTVLVPAIVLAEALMTIEKARIAVDANRVVEAVETTWGFQLIPLLPATVLATRSLTMLPDIHDRLIVAEALASDASLITRDETIRASRIVPTVW